MFLSFTAYCRKETKRPKFRGTKKKKWSNESLTHRDVACLFRTPEHKYPLALWDISSTAPSGLAEKSWRGVQATIGANPGPVRPPVRSRAAPLGKPVKSHEQDMEPHGQFIIRAECEATTYQVWYKLIWLLICAGCSDALKLTEFHPSLQMISGQNMQLSWAMLHQMRRKTSCFFLFFFGFGSPRMSFLIPPSHSLPPLHPKKHCEMWRRGTPSPSGCLN